MPNRCGARKIHRVTVSSTPSPTRRNRIMVVLLFSNKYDRLYATLVRLSMLIISPRSKMAGANSWIVLVMIVLISYFHSGMHAMCPPTNATSSLGVQYVHRTSNVPIPVRYHICMPMPSHIYAISSEGLLRRNLTFIVHRMCCVCV